MRTNYVCVVVIFLMLGRFVFHFFPQDENHGALINPRIKTKKKIFVNRIK
jgi:hypothetical protein